MFRIRHHQLCLKYNLLRSKIDKNLACLVYVVVTLLQQPVSRPSLHAVLQEPTNGGDKQTQGCV